MRNPAASPQLKQLSDENNLPITILPMDVLDDDSVTTCINKVVTIEDRIDVLVNNAGVGKMGAVEEMDMALFKNDMDTNYFGTLRCIKAVLPGMRQRKSGLIINVTSVAGKVYTNFFSSYCASKAATEALSESLGQELKPFNIQVAIVEPGVIETPIFKKVNTVPADTNYPYIKRFYSIFSASLEFHTPPSAVAEVINDIISGKNTSLRHTAGPDAVGLVQWRSSTSDEDWVDSGGISNEDWVNGMEQMGLKVKKYVEADELPQIHMA
jgi:short-subunit dehydrogenase